MGSMVVCYSVTNGSIEKSRLSVEQFVGKEHGKI